MVRALALHSSYVAVCWDGRGCAYVQSWIGVCSRGAAAECLAPDEDPEAAGAASPAGSVAAVVIRDAVLGMPRRFVSHNTAGSLNLTKQQQQERKSAIARGKGKSVSAEKEDRPCVGPRKKKKRGGGHDKTPHTRTHKPGWLSEKRGCCCEAQASVRTLLRLTRAIAFPSSPPLRTHHIGTMWMMSRMGRVHASAMRRAFAGQPRKYTRMATVAGRPRVGWPPMLVQQRTMLPSRSMFIQTESTPNEDSLKFLPGCRVMEKGTAEFLDQRSSMTSPLAKDLFALDGVSGVFYGPDFVTVTKDTDTPWAAIKPEVYSTMMEFFTAGHSLFPDPSSAQPGSDTTILDTDSEVVAMIKELLDTRVRPAIQEDGGDLEYRGFGEDSDGIVRVKLKGSCRGCDSSTVTLKSGIERMLMHYVPEVQGVEQVLDPEEQVAMDEFTKLEDRLKKQREERARGFSL